MKEIRNYINEKLKINDETIKSSQYSQFKADHINKNNYEKFLNNANLQDNVQEWYHKEYDTDELWEYIDKDITFADAIERLFTITNLNDDFDRYDKEVLAGDSIVRERIFSELSERCDVPYRDFYEFYMKL